MVALFVDGKTIADEELIIALGVTLDGGEGPYGFRGDRHRDERDCQRFLADLVDRGLPYEAGRPMKRRKRPEEERTAQDQLI